MNITYPLLLSFILFAINVFGQTQTLENDEPFFSKSYAEGTESLAASDIDTVFSFKIPEGVPMGICWDGSNIWCSSSSEYIYKMTTEGVVVDSILHPVVDSKIRCGGMTSDGNNIWLVEEQSAKLFQIDLNGNKLKEYDLPSEKTEDPNGFGIAWDGRYLWHSQYSPSAIVKIDPEDGRILYSFLPESKVLGLEWIDNKLYGIAKTNLHYSFVQIDIKTGQFVDAIDWIITEPRDIFFGDSYLWNISGGAGPYGTNFGKNKIYQVQLNSIITSIVCESIADSLRIYPNPFSSFLIFEDVYQDSQAIYILNSKGDIVKTFFLYSSKEFVDLSQLKPGIYMIKRNDTIYKVLKE